MKIINLFCFLCMLLPFVAVQTGGPDEPTQLAYAIGNPPTAIVATAGALDIPPIGFVPPKFYTSGKDRTWDRAKAERNLDAITAIVDGSKRIILDTEGKNRDRVRHPDRYPELEVKASANQFVAGWSWFRSHWPDKWIFEWNLCNAKEAGVYPFAEQLVLKHLDGFAISLYWQDRATWPITRGQMIAHAQSLVAGTDKIVIGGIWDRYKVRHDEDDIIEYRPVSHENVHVMIDVAMDCDVVFLWSNTYSIYARTGSKRVLTEVLQGDENPLPEINAHMLDLLVRMRLGEKE